jgi:hypothetical protein
LNGDIKKRNRTTTPGVQVEKFSFVREFFISIVKKCAVAPVLWATEMTGPFWTFWRCYAAHEAPTAQIRIEKILDMAKACSH